MLIFQAPAIWSFFMSFAEMYNQSKELLLEVPDPEFIKELRLSLGLSAKECSKIAGLNDAAIWNKYENGTRSPNAQTWTFFCLAIGKHPQFDLQKH
jgi:hypothetical protein